MRDFDIRSTLKQTKLIHFFNDGSSKIVDEFTFPSTNSRIDIAVINCELHGYEIKSSRDTLQRLPNQLIGYEKVLDYLHVVAEPKHIVHIEKILPDWVGLTVCQEVNSNVELLDIKLSNKNPHKEAFHIAKLLWRDEIIDILNANNIKFRKKDRNWLLCEVLAANLELDFISKEVRNKIKLRDSWKLGKQVY
ncbi:sce7726 family protein [Mucilaginibacter sp. CSA2-8R]|uniref:sce7726 family protein n=1 Tax=Mucilaginibacter sp. CSA2-8R TaxID=3141542 RepID=UPI00315DD77C